MEHENEVPPKLTLWHMQNPIKPPYECRLTKLLSAINDIIRPQTAIENIYDNAPSRWKTAEILGIYIPIRTKTATAEQHKD
jgi:hypothetical protein